MVSFRNEPTVSLTGAPAWSVLLFLLVQIVNATMKKNVETTTESIHRGGHIHFLPFLSLTLVSTIGALFSTPLFQLPASASGPIIGQTPCCVDRLTTVICNRQKQQNLALFIGKCMRNSDFSFVQCCRTCFEHGAADAYRLDYAKTTEFLLTDPLTAQCSDRRGAEWCDLFVQRRLNRATGRTKPGMGVPAKFDCSNVPLAFRLCRRSCGYCSAGSRPSEAVYDYGVAKDAIKCYNPAKGLAQRGTDMKEVYRDFAQRFVKHQVPFKTEISRRRRRKLSQATTTTTTTSTADPYLEEFQAEINYWEVEEDFLSRDSSSDAAVDDDY